MRSVPAGSEAFNVQATRVTGIPLHVEQGQPIITSAEVMGVRDGFHIVVGVGCHPAH